MRVVQHRDDDSASSSSEDELEDEDDVANDDGSASDDDDAALPARADDAAPAAAARAPLAPSGRAPGAKIKLTLQACGANGRCKACGSTTHTAGFQGAVYVDCPDRPCYLCKQVRASAAGACGARSGDAPLTRRHTTLAAKRSRDTRRRHVRSGWRQKQVSLQPAARTLAGALPARRCGWHDARRALLRLPLRSTRRQSTGVSPPPTTSCTGTRPGPSRRAPAARRTAVTC